MQSLLEKFFANQSLLQKGFLYIITIILIVYLFPRGSQFKYDFSKGKPWQYDNLYAPFDFPLHKTEEELQLERQDLSKNQIKYFRYDEVKADSIRNGYQFRFDRYLIDSLFEDSSRARVYNAGRKIVEELLEFGLVQDAKDMKADKPVFLIRGVVEERVKPEQFLTMGRLRNHIEQNLSKAGLQDFSDPFYNLFFEITNPNVFYDDDFTQKVLQASLDGISLTLGSIERGQLIVAKGELIEDQEFVILNSLKEEYESQLWNETNYYYVVFGYTVLVALALMMLLLFLKKYRSDIFDNNTKVAFIFFNISLVVFLTTVVVKYNPSYVLVVPISILPLVLKAFFDARLGLFVHVIAVLLLGFVVPRSLEYIFLQIIAGIVTVLTTSELYRRANLFISVGQITAVYMVAYFAFHIIQEGSLQNLEWLAFGLFILNGLATLFAHPLIYIYEKLFGLVSDVSLLELSDTNTRLLKELANVAPGTFHHSLQVANLAEAAASEIGANSMLVRVGALYHDIGKMNNAAYFSENQVTNVNPHDDLAPKESAQIIVGHVLEGIEMARKNKLPDRLIDFIRTHHGTSVVYYFYKKQEELTGQTPDKANFQYPGPLPFSKETSILMMADSVEAASKSLKNPSISVISDFVERIVDKQVEAGQFANANITFKEIGIIKKVLKKKLTNIYHLRVEYPE